MKQILTLLTILLLAGALSVQAAVVSRIAAVVNDEIITTRQLDLALQKELDAQLAEPAPAQLGALRKELLSRLIEERLIQQRIAALGLSVTDEELELALQDVQAQNQLDRAQLEEAVTAQGLSFEEYRENLRSQILRYKLIGVEVRRQIDVSDGEVRDYYRAHEDDYRLEPQTVLSAVVFPVTERAGLVERDAVRAAAADAAGQLAAGADMEKVAGAFSTSHGASFLPLGGVVAAELDPDFAAAIEEVEAGGYAEPVEKEAALFLLRVDSRQEGGLRPYESVENEIRQHLMEQKTDVRSKEWVKALKQKALIDIRI